MEAYSIKNLNFSYPYSNFYSLNNINLKIYSGDFLAVCGPSGCGKSTLLRLLKTVIQPAGNIEGNILFFGKELDSISFREQSQKIGYVTQMPDNQIVTDKVWHELAFGLESLGYSSTEIRKRVAEMASFFGIQSWYYKKVDELSGGQKQLLNLAAVMCSQPDVLILDEPTSQLDPISAQNFLSMVAKINKEMGVTVVISEHRMEEVMPFCTGIAAIDNGQLIAVDTPKNICGALYKMKSSVFSSMPSYMQIWQYLSGKGDCPVTVSEGKKWLEYYSELSKPNLIKTYKTDSSYGKKAIQLENIRFSFSNNPEPLLNGLDLTVHFGEIYSLLGNNGAGKSTLLNIITGTLPTTEGQIIIDGRPLSKHTHPFREMISFLPQNPQTLFEEKTVLKDLELMLSKDDKSVINNNMLSEVIELCNLEDILQLHPYDLSGGELQRAALAKVLLTSPKILLLDEPTKGMDGSFKESFANILISLKKRGIGILLISHDIEFCASYSDRCGLIFDGKIIREEEPCTFFSDNSFYTTSIAKMASKCCPGAVTTRQLLNCYGINNIHIDFTSYDRIRTSDNQIEIEEEQINHRSAKSIIISVVSLLLIPLTIYIGYFYISEKRMLFITLLILFESMIPFFALFEGKKPKAKELVLIAVLCAIGVASRAALYMLPYFKPVMALVIISGTALGAESGFLIGALTMLLSNIMFGQGMWTPWQMFAMGIIGFFAGILFYRSKIKYKKVALCIYGFISAVMIYGFILNPASAIMSGIELSWKVIIAYEISGLPLDIVHGIATSFFLIIGAKPIMEKIERLQIKYNIFV